MDSALDRLSISIQLNFYQKHKFLLAPFVGIWCFRYKPESLIKLSMTTYSQCKWQGMTMIGPGASESSDFFITAHLQQVSHAQELLLGRQQDRFEDHLQQERRPQ